MRTPLLVVTHTLCAMVAYASGHVTIEGSIESSVTYPGTIHSYTVTIPDNYDGTTPAALYLGLDGVLCSAPDVIDSLINENLIPVTIGVFLQPGLIKDRNGETIRYNRSNEFDAIDGRFASFIEEELLPAIDGMTIADGRRVILSVLPSDRMIFGLSSGGIAAFAAAWNRPDLFGRVFSGCGTFVAMRGGNDLQAIVRKSEPKPLKIFLQDGFDDAWNPLFGSWFEGNKILGSALEFAGYDCRFDWAEGGHSVRRANEIFPDVMTWMWNDHAKVLPTRPTSNDFLKGLLIADERWSASGKEHNGTHVPMRNAVYPDGSLIAEYAEGSNSLTQSIIDPETGERLHCQRFYWLHNLDNAMLAVGGMSFDGDGNLWVVTDAGIQICDQNGRVRGIISIPHGLAAATTAIIINDGSVELIPTGNKRQGFTRKFNVKAPIPGQRPASQGQG